MEETIKTVQDLKMEIKEIKERYNEGNWDEKNLGIQTGTSGDNHHQENTRDGRPQTSEI